MDTKAHRHPHPVARLEIGVECLQDPHNPQTSTHGAPRVVFVRLGIAKVDEQTVAEILRNVPVKAPDDLGTGTLLGAHDFPQVLRVEGGGEGRGAHQVTEQDR